MNQLQVECPPKPVRSAGPRDDDADAWVRTETNVEIADRLGVDEKLVRQVVKNRIDPIIYHDRLEARRYYRENPDASYREVARQVDASQPTVTEWLKADFDERLGSRIPASLPVGLAVGIVVSHW